MEQTNDIKKNMQMLLYGLSITIWFHNSER